MCKYIYNTDLFVQQVVRMERLNPKKIALANDVSTGVIYSCEFKDAKVEWRGSSDNKGESHVGTKNKENKEK